MRLLLYLFVNVCAALAVNSCAYYGAAKIDSSPQGAQVYEFGSSTLLGVTPFVYTWREVKSEELVQVKQAQHVTVRVVKRGCKTRMEAFSVPLRYTDPGEAEQNPVPVMLILEEN